MKRTVIILAGSRSDADWADEIWGMISEECTKEIHFASAHRNTPDVLALLQMHDIPDEKVIFVTIAGRSNALSGVVACNTRHPVIACPPLRTDTDYLIDIHSTMRMPKGVPVMAVLGTQNCAMAVDRLLKSMGQ
jgi:5-(carboxyamino)imidazole ribonucleotide mutase